MLITASNLNNLFTGFKTNFNKGFQGAPSTYPKIAMDVPSGSAEEKYAWLGTLPALRKWVGPRIVHSLQVHGYTVENVPFEVTISVSQDDIEDDKVGVFAPLFENMGYESRRHPDELVYALLSSGFDAPCYDGKPFFSAEHLLHEGENVVGQQSNMQDGAGPAWFLIDGTKPFKPLVFQKRRDYEFQRQDNPNDPNVFEKREYIYGVFARVNAGFGLWQLAYASKAPLTVENYEAARTAMTELRGDNGRKLGVTPNILVVPTALDGAGRRVVNSTTRVVTVGMPPDEQSVAISNEWAGSAELLVSAYL